MYLPSHFEESDPQALHALIRDYPLGLLVSHGEAGLDANHLPFELSPERARKAPWKPMSRATTRFGASCATATRCWWCSAPAMPTSRRSGTRASRSTTARCRPGTTGWSTPTAGCGSATTNAMCADWWRA